MMTKIFTPTPIRTTSSRFTSLWEKDQENDYTSRTCEKASNRIVTDLTYMLEWLVESVSYIISEMGFLRPK